MKIRNIVFAAAMALLALTGCNKEIDYGPAKVEVDKTELQVAKEAGSVTVSLTATIDWAAKVDTEDADWLDISPAKGTRSLDAQTLTIKFTENTGINREATILVQGDVLHKTYINVKQAGPKGDEDTCTIAEFIQKGDTKNPYVLTGTVSNFLTSTNSSSGEKYYSFNITDESGTILVYSFTEASKAIAATVKNGGKIKVKGFYQYYESKSQHEVVNAEILSYEAPAPIDPSKLETLTVKEFLDKADATTAYKLVGTITSYNAQYSSFYLKDSTGSIYIYTIDAESKTNFGDKIANGKKVTLYGFYYWYESASNPSSNKAEINPATIISIEEGETEDYSKAEAKTVAEFLAAKDTETYYKLTGVVSGYDSKYCNFNLTDETGTVYVYGPQNKSEWISKISDGGTVTLAGKFYHYEHATDPTKSKDEVQDAFIISFTAAEGGEEDYENAPAKTVAEFLSLQDTETYFKLTGVVSDYDASYCDLNLTDETGTVFVYGAKNKSAWASKIKNGGTITLAGKFYHYENAEDPTKSKDEVKDAYILSFTPGEGGEEEGGDEPPTDITKVTVAEFLAAPVSLTTWYQLTGVITNIANTTYGNFTIKDDTGEVYIYGLTKNYVKTNDQSFASLGLKKGDTVTLNGLRAEYQGTIETAGAPPAFYVSHVPGEEEKVPEGTVTLIFPDDNSGSNGLTTKQYESEWTAKSGACEFKIFAFNNNNWKNWSYIRAGRKADPSVATITTATAITSKVEKVVVTVDSITAADVNSMKVISASDAAFTADVAEVSVTPAQGDVTFAIAAPAEKMYYKLVIDCKASSAGKNGFVQISKVAYIAAE